MKKTAVIVTALITAMMLSGTALAETPAPAEPTQANMQTEAAEKAAAEKNAFLSWIGEGADMLTNVLSDGWDKASDAVTSGMDWLDEKIADWTDQAEAYMQQKQWDKKVQDAWETLKTGAQQSGEKAGEKLTEAYHTVQAWLTETGETVDQGVAEAVDRVAEAAGVAEAKLSGWYRKMENYMTEKAGLVTESAREAWNVIKQNASAAGSVAKETLCDAYSAIREWLESLGEPEDAELIQTLDEISAQQE